MTLIDHFATKHTNVPLARHPARQLVPARECDKRWRAEDHPDSRGKDSDCMHSHPIDPITPWRRRKLAAFAAVTAIGFVCTTKAAFARAEVTSPDVEDVPGVTAGGIAPMAASMSGPVTAAEVHDAANDLSATCRFPATLQTTEGQNHAAASHGR